jgi:hypothetical protein
MIKENCAKGVFFNLPQFSLNTDNSKQIILEKSNAKSVK